VKILILKPSSLGDVVLSLPVLRLLKQHLPQAEIHWWIETAFAPLLEGDPDLSGVILFDRRAWKSPLNWAAPVRSVRSVRKQHFDWVIDLQALARSAAFGWFANGGLFIGLDDSREWASGFYDVAVRRPVSRHAADWYLEVLPALGVPVHRNFTWLPPRPAVTQQIVQKWPIKAHRWIALQPGARWLTKRWPAEHFAALVREFSRKHPEFRFAILGGKTDEELGRTVWSGNPDACLDLTGKTSLPEMIEWIRACELMVTNDTGPMHVATALGKPLVALLGPTNALHTGPYHRPEDVLQLQLPCVPCRSGRCRNVREMECLRDLPPQAVVAAVEKRLG
jgi:lipopolysaccharide heptosyltransferase II